MATIRIVNAIGRAAVGAVLGVGLMLTAATAEATSLGLTPGSPDISATLNIDYSGGVFTATISNSIGNYVPGDLTVSSLNYTLTANVSSTGVFSGGTVSISGKVPDAGIPTATTLLTADLTDFGFDLSGGQKTFEFLFDTTAAAPELDFGPTGGIILSSFDVLATSFGSAFSGEASSDTYTTAAPEPATLALLALGAAGLARRRQAAPRR